VSRLPSVSVGRTLWLVVAHLCFGLALAGIVLPVLPTTPFALAAAYAAARSSPRLHARLVSHPVLGPPLRDWRVHRAVSRRSKRLALGTMSVSAVLVLLLSPALWLAAGTVAILAVVGSWLWLRPEPPVAE